MGTPFVIGRHIFDNPSLKFLFRPLIAPVPFFLLQGGEEKFYRPVLIKSIPFGKG